MRILTIHRESTEFTVQNCNVQVEKFSTAKASNTLPKLGKPTVLLTQRNIHTDGNNNITLMTF